jgi:hypothetical protein
MKGKQFVGLKVVLPGVSFILWIQVMSISNNKKRNKKVKMCYLGDRGS